MASETARAFSRFVTSFFSKSKNVTFYWVSELLRAVSRTLACACGRSQVAATLRVAGGTARACCVLRDRLAAM